ncbi:MAG: MBOAT family O-acyltransferase [Lachnospirales bacterium]
MLFSSQVFLWFFLPLVFLLYFAAPGLKIKNTILLLFSLFFYAWGEPRYIVLMLVSICLNYLFGLAIEKAGEKKRLRTGLLWLCVAVNLGLLGYFKYFNFFLQIGNRLFGKEVLAYRDIALPIGISFYTFQAMSYVVDVWRGENKAQKNLWNLALYISFFPQLIAGPIVKYHDIEQQLTVRKTDLSGFCYGIKRFCYGLGKKVIISNSMALAADQIYGLPFEHIGTALAWWGVGLYTLQIYFDFSGYSDMAIGLGRMFGFRFMENFNYPYLSRSVTEFWRRWHISLSTWFREYVYIPLGGNRKGRYRTYLNLFLVFCLTGLWHGASLNFVFWGIYYGILIVLERMTGKKPGWLGTMFLVVIGWLMFRVTSMRGILILLKNMFIPCAGLYPVSLYVTKKTVVLAAAGILLCGPLQAFVPQLKERLYDEDKIGILDILAMAGIFGYSMLLLISSTYNPFIYFRF